MTFSLRRLELLHERACAAGLSDFESWGCVMTAQAEVQLHGMAALAHGGFDRLIADVVAERPVRAALAAKWAAVCDKSMPVVDSGWNADEYDDETEVA